MNNEVYLVPKDELYHYGVKGMKWGHRKARYTSEAGKRYYSARNDYKQSKKAYDKSFSNARTRVAIAQDLHKSGHYNNAIRDNVRKAGDKANVDKAAMRKAKAEYKDAKKEYKQSEEYAAKRKKALKVGAAVAGTALAAYGAYKLNDYVKKENTKIAMERGKKAMNDYMDDNTVYLHPQRSDGGIQFEKGAIRRGTYTTGITRSLNSEEATDMFIKTKRHNMAVAKKGGELLKAELERARNDSFAKAAKNVYDYKKRKR